MQLDWLDILYKVFEVALIPIIAAGTMYLVSLINAKKQELLAKADSELSKKYIEMLDKTITECVIATTQTYVDTLKKQGSFDEAAQKVAFQMTFDAVMAVLTEDAQEYLSESIKDLNAYITTQIETQVAMTKRVY